MNNSWWRDLFRLRCAAIIDARYKKMYSTKVLDRLMPDGMIEEGEEINVFSVLICKRWRFHRGPCR